MVFTGLEDLAARIDDPDLDVRPGDVLVLQNAGPQAAGMPEAGYLPIPKKLAQAGVKDMVRISDARMSGTAFGTIVLHVAPEAAVGGPLAAVRDGDRIRLSVASKRIDLLVDAGRDRRAGSRGFRPPPSRRPAATRRSTAAAVTAGARKAATSTSSPGQARPRSRRHARDPAAIGQPVVALHRAAAARPPRRRGARRLHRRRDARPLRGARAASCAPGSTPRG